MKFKYLSKTDDLTSYNAHHLTDTKTPTTVSLNRKEVKIQDIDATNGTDVDILVITDNIPLRKVFSVAEKMGIKRIAVLIRGGEEDSYYTIYQILS